MNAHWNGAKLEIGCIEKICEQLCLWSLAKSKIFKYRIEFFFFQNFSTIFHSIIDNEEKDQKEDQK